MDRSMIGLSTWEAPFPGPVAREALEAIGLPGDVERLVIEVQDRWITVNGTPATESDASLVYNAWRCDPHPFRDDPSEMLVQHMRRAITIRRMLTVPVAGAGA
jgi:hypothetical protein